MKHIKKFNETLENNSFKKEYNRIGIKYNGDPK